MFQPPWFQWFFLRCLLFEDRKKAELDKLQDIGPKIKLQARLQRNLETVECGSNTHQKNCIFDLLVEYAEYVPCKIIMPYWLWHLRTRQCWFAGTRNSTMCIQYKFCKYVQLKMFPFNKSSPSISWLGRAERLSVRLQSCLTWRVSMKSLHFIPTLASTLLSDQETRAITSRSVGWSPQAKSGRGMETVQHLNLTRTARVLMRQKRQSYSGCHHDRILTTEPALHPVIWPEFLSAKCRTKKENAMAGLKITNASTTCLSRRICWIRQFAKLKICLKTIWKWLMHCKTLRHYDERQDLLQRKGSSCEPFAVKGHLWLYDLP